MPDQLVGLTGAASADRIRSGGIGAHVGTALFFSHGHADGDAAFLLHRQVARVIAPAENLRQPDVGDARLLS